MEDLESRTNLAFPKDLSAEEVKKMLEHLSNANYSFNIVQTGFFNTGAGEDRKTTEDYINSLSGSVTDRRSYTQTGISFQINDNSENYPGFKGVRFPTTPGYDWNEISEPERDLIESLTKDISEYLLTQ